MGISPGKTDEKRVSDLSKSQPNSVYKLSEIVQVGHFLEKKPQPELLFSEKMSHLDDFGQFVDGIWSRKYDDVAPFAAGLRGSVHHTN